MQTGTYLQAGDVAARYKVSAMTLWRWLRNERLQFPKPMRVNNRRFWKLADLEAWEESRSEGGANASA